MKARQISLSVGLALLIAGCGGSAQTTSATEPTDTLAAVASTTPAADDTAPNETSSGVDDACVLLSTEDLAAAAGGSWGEPRNVPSRQSVECDYNEDSRAATFFVAVYNEEAIAAGGGAESFFDSLVTEAGAGGTEIEAGDRAFFYIKFFTQQQVIMLVGDAVIETHGEIFSDVVAFDQENMTTIARIVADNL